jgi:hypothetical protein
VRNTLNGRPGSWRGEVLRFFSAEIASVTRTTVVADADGLLLDDALATELAKQGFDVVPYRDAVEFRFYYESRHRSRWDAGEHSSIVVSVPRARLGLQRVPFDVLSQAEAAGRVVDISLAVIFPNLATEVLAELDPADLDTVWAAAQSLGKETLGGNQTRDFVLRSVFKLSPEMIANTTDAVVQLLRLHHAKRTVPRTLAARFAETLQRNSGFDGWPIAELVSSSDEFFRLVQDRWERRIHAIDPDVPVRANIPAEAVEIDFDAPEVAAIIDNLFLEGRLTAVEVLEPETFRSRMEAVGVRGSGSAASAAGVQRLLNTVRDQIPEPGVPPTVWTRFAQHWSDMVGVVDSLSADDWTSVREDVLRVQTEVDSRLWTWLVERFGGLVNRAFVPIPTMVHQIPHLMAYRRTPGDRVAVVIVDGMSLSQWAQVKRAAESDWMDGLLVDEAAVFAWVPTVTSISRQALLSGLAPMFFDSTVHTTSAEERHWKTFWEERGWRRDRVGFIKQRDGEQESSLIQRTEDLVEAQGVECLAVIVNSVDRLVHGVGPEGSILAAAIRQWAANGHIIALVRYLASRGFDVAICSDHGNVEAVGVGRPDLGTIPEDLGQRAIIFADAAMLEVAKSGLAGSRRWPGAGLPSSMQVLLPGGRQAFSTAGGRIRTHGGVSIEEILVPFVRVSRGT